MSNFSDPLGEKEIAALKASVMRKRIEQKIKRERIALAAEKGFHPGCRIQYRENKNVCCILKMVAKDGFLIPEKSSNKLRPDEWDVVL